MGATLTPIPDAELNLGVCAPCKRAKKRCRFVPGAIVCSQCQTKGLSTECIVDPPKPRTRGARSNSVDILENQIGQGSSASVKPMTGRKRSNSDTSSQVAQAAGNYPAKHPRLALRQTPLDSITEEADSLADTLVSDAKYVHAVPPIGKAQFIDALAGGHDEGNESLEMENPVEGDVEISSGDDSELGSSEDDDVDGMHTGMKSYFSKPVTWQTQARTKKMMKPQSMGPYIKHERTPNVEDTYDPLTCCE